VIKARVVSLREGRAPASASLHLNYIEREGVEKDGSKGKLYSANENIDRTALAAELPDERHQFRFIVSPEDGEALDLTTFAKELMAQVERDTGRRLIWGAVNHHDTDNPHVHIVVRGVDQAGKEVRIERAYISERLRWQAQHLVTKELGPRSEVELGRQLDREVGQERFTSLDRALSAVAGDTGALDVRRLALTVDGKTRGRLVGRLKVLETFGLASRTSARTWRLETGWESVLRQLGQRGDIVKRIHQALHGKGDPARYAVVDGNVEHPVIEGIVRKKGLHDELRGDFYAVIETERGQAHYVQLEPAIGETVREGAVVRIEVKRESWAKPPDRVIERIASRAGGIYDPKTHLQELRRRPLVIGGSTVEPAAVIDVNLRRLRRLARHELVTELPDGTWRVPPNLGKVLSDRERSHPKFRTDVEVLLGGMDELRGPAGDRWLGARAQGSETWARWGFGAEISGALREREAHLARPAPGGEAAPSTPAVLDRELGLLARNIAARTGDVFLTEIPPKFRGRVLAGEATASGMEFVRIVDPSSRGFVLLPRAAVPPSLEGKAVVLDRDSKGRVAVRPAGLSRGE
jgi:type IV secretory pathway VirD2 relaxase